MKPIASYSLALDNNVITYSSLYQDQPITLHDGKKWPVNWYNYYGGMVTVQNALERSINTVPAQLVEKLSMENVFDHLVNDMGITTLVRNSNADLTYSALALGSCYHGITTTESCAAYATFGNKGRYYEPTFYYKVTDQKNNVVLDGKPEAKVAMAEDTAYIMNRLLRTVVDGSQGTGKIARSYVPKMPIYAKTGTTNDDENCWFAGGTPYYVASCWYGYDQPERVSKSNSAAVLWSKVMKEIHKDLEYKEFPECDYVTKRNYCTETGLIATSKCENTGVGWYKKSNLQTCTTHRGQITEEIKDVTSDTSSTSSENAPSGTSLNVSSVPQ
jgi:penicillin-binding protein 1A